MNGKKFTCKGFFWVDKDQVLSLFLERKLSNAELSVKTPLISAGFDKPAACFDKPDEFYLYLPAKFHKISKIVEHVYGFAG